jgi:hypothetical protein
VRDNNCEPEESFPKNLTSKETFSDQEEIIYKESGVERWILTTFGAQNAQQINA